MPTLACSGLPMSSRSSTDGLDQREPGVDRALRRVLARMRIAEIGQYAIAQIPRDEAASLFDRVSRNVCDRGP